MVAGSLVILTFCAIGTNAIGLDPQLSSTIVFPLTSQASESASKWVADTGDTLTRSIQDKAKSVYVEQKTEVFNQYKAKVDKLEAQYQDDYKKARQLLYVAKHPPAWKKAAQGVAGELLDQSSSMYQAEWEAEENKWEKKISDARDEEAKMTTAAAIMKAQLVSEKEADVRFWEDVAVTKVEKAQEASQQASQDATVMLVDMQQKSLDMIREAKQNLTDAKAMMIPRKKMMHEKNASLANFRSKTVPDGKAKSRALVAAASEREAKQMDLLTAQQNILVGTSKGEVTVKGLDEVVKEANEKKVVALAVNEGLEADIATLETETKAAKDLKLAHDEQRMAIKASWKDSPEKLKRLEQYKQMKTEVENSHRLSKKEIKDTATNNAEIARLTGLVSEKEEQIAAKVEAVTAKMEAEVAKRGEVDAMKAAANAAHATSVGAIKIKTQEKDELKKAFNTKFSQLDTSMSAAQKSKADLVVALESNKKLSDASQVTGSKYSTVNDELTKKSAELATKMALKEEKEAALAQMTTANEKDVKDSIEAEKLTKTLKADIKLINLKLAALSIS